MRAKTFLSRFYMPVSYKLFLGYDLNQMGMFLKLLEKFLEREINEIDSEFELMFEKNEIEEEEAFRMLDQHTDKTLDVGFAFPQFFYNAFIISWFAYIDQILNDFCIKAKDAKTDAPNDNTNLGKGIERSYKLLRTRKDYEINQEKWNELLKIRRVRNILVHEGTRILTTLTPQKSTDVKLDSPRGYQVYLPYDKTFYNYLNKYFSIEISYPWTNLISTNEYCVYLVDFGKDLIFEIYEGLFKKSMEKSNGK